MAADGWEEIASSIDNWLDGVLEAVPAGATGVSVD
jgi:hypothetical protein